jgi:hypothetical protein
MKSRKCSYGSLIGTGLAFALALSTYTPSAHANVYASNIKVNGVLQGSATVGQGVGATITYILNEPASLGLTVQIYSGATLVRAIAIAGGSSGTTQGLNSVVWDGKNDSNVAVPLGDYSVKITASSNGYLDWTLIIDNTNPKIYWPSGIAVDTRTDSPYYGRVMVANGVNTANNVPANPVGIVKFNADGSEGDEGQSNAGNPFRTDAYLSDSVRSIKYGTDDRIYFLDWVGNGKVIACDMIMSTNQLIFDANLNPILRGLTSGMADMDITEPGTTNGLVWLADADYPSVGVYAFPLTNNGAADSTSAGFNVLAPGPNIPLRTGFGMMVDDTGDVFIGEVRGNTGDPNPRAISITNVWGASIGYPTNWWNTVETFPIVDTDLNWSVGQSDDTFRSIAALAIDSRTSPKYVACAMSAGSGGVRILNAADGTLVTNINQGVTMNYIGTCFDNVGNVYAGNANTASSWQAFSPPGANQATTPAVVRVQVVAPPRITSINVSGGTATIQFTSAATDPSSAFTLDSAGVVDGIYSPASGAVITGSGGTYQATVSTSGPTQYYRITR